MKAEEYVEYIKLSLGSPIINIELTDKDLLDIVNMAFKEIVHYITDTDTLTIKYREKIHMEDYKDNEKDRIINVDTIVYVQRSNTPNRIADYQDIMYLMNRQSTLNTVSLTDYDRALLTTQVKNTISTDLDFYWDKKYKNLYVYANYPKPDFITIVYIPVYNSIEEIEESYWQNLLKRLAKGLTKEVLGRIRGKYKVPGAQYSLDSEQLLSESQQELSEVRRILDENSDMLLPID